MDKDIVWQFVEAINSQNLPLIIKRMAEDFCFIDTYAGKANGEQMKTGWQGYFDWFPDYKIKVDEINGKVTVVYMRFYPAF